jgi:CheY-like chemotaxis protein
VVEAADPDADRQGHARRPGAKCIAAGANDYMAKPIDVDKLLSLVRVWMPR